jgi:hypothetical protein
MHWRGATTSRATGAADDMLTVYFLVAVLVFVGIEFWAARGTGLERPAIAVLGTAAVTTAMAAMIRFDVLVIVVLFVSSLVGTFIVVAPGVWAIRSGLRDQPGVVVGASVALLTCATAALGFFVGGLIVFGTITTLLRKCC